MVDDLSFVDMVPVFENRFAGVYQGLEGLHYGGRRNQVYKGVEYLGMVE